MILYKMDIVFEIGGRNILNIRCISVNINWRTSRGFLLKNLMCLCVRESLQAGVACMNSRLMIGLDKLTSQSTVCLWPTTTNWQHTPLLKSWGGLCVYLRVCAWLCKVCLVGWLVFITLSLQGGAGEREEREEVYGKEGKTSSHADSSLAACSIPIPPLFPFSVRQSRT